MTHAPLLSRLDALDAALRARGFPAMSPWWLDVFRRFLASSRRQLVLRVGRRGGKSSSLCRLAVLFALYGTFAIPPGDVGVVAFISTTRPEAAERLRTIEAILLALNVPHKRTTDTGGTPIIELPGRPIVFKVFVATVAGVSGFTAIAVIADEVAKWRDSDTGANPAREVLASVRPTIATQPAARIFLSSSPLGTQDAHAAAFDAGDTDFQLTAHAPSWVANPSLTEAECRPLEPDERVFMREYGAVPQAGAVGAFDMRDVDACIRRPEGTLQPLSSPVVVLDSAAGAGDAWTWALARFATPRTSVSDYMLLHGGAVKIPTRHEELAALVHVYGMDAVEGAFAGRVTATEVVARIAAAAKRAGAKRVFADQYQAFVLSSAFAEHQIGFLSLAWSAQSKVDAVARVRQWLRERSILIEPGEHAERLRRELAAFEERISPSGALTYGARRGKHDDHVALLLTLAMADVEGHVGGSPIRERRGRVVFDDTTFEYG